MAGLTGDDKHISAINRLIEQHAEIESYHSGLPNPGENCDGICYKGIMRDIDDSYKFGNEIYAQKVKNPLDNTFYDSGDGGPLISDPFRPALDNCKEIMYSTEMNRYAFASGDKKCREKVRDYLCANDFHVNENEEINVNQIIFTNSLTEAMTLLMKLICRKADVVLFTAPTYGLLAYCPEREGANARFVSLRKKDNWLINPAILEECICSINNELERNNTRNYVPRVVAFVNINPNNPTGKVMGKKHIPLLKEIAEVCDRHGVFVIDDLIYMDLCFNMEDKAVPIATIPGTFKNTITLLGLSKCYGMPAARAGMIFADEVIIRGIRNELFQLMDSTSLILSYLIAGAFNNDPGHSQSYRNYFASIIPRYIKNWKIVEYLVTGDDSAIDDVTCAKVKKKLGDGFNAKKIGIPYLSLAEDIRPESGFFSVIDFTDMLGKIDGNLIIKSENDVVCWVYNNANIKLLPGSSFAWPVENTVVARVSFAFPEDSLIEMFGQLYTALERLRQENEV